ncbi:TPA: hypothetical protein N0F65_011665 [Lagenidium giganteum]|uniref:Glucokinase n=1 Tax=Lagenidium giganteum TaxID=4803 RepID=A0AAV2ZAI1_9STRA|nr:TPA: hypothetical protein N0F65_011665 [Lagenidium giganteum]
MGALEELYAGIDVGGTNVKVGIVDARGNVLLRKHDPINMHDAPPDVIVGLGKKLLEETLVECNLKQEQLLGVGIGCPGQVELSGVVHAAANFPSWHDVPLQQLFADALGLPVTLCNDADAAVLAEQWVGSAKDNIKNFIMLTLGTGVGFGLIVDGKLVRGGTNTIEGGHLIVERNGRLCGCSQRGCLEAYSSAGALVLEAQEHVNAGADSKLAAYPPEEINAKLMFDLAAEGDQMCKRLIEEAAEYLGFACVSFSRILDPEMIVLSGGMANAGPHFIDLVRKFYTKYAWTRFPNPVRIELANAGYDSGIIGAAASFKLL